MANVIITLLKDEEPLVLDFILHHVSIGFDRIVLFDDASANPVSHLVATLPAAIAEKVICCRQETDFNNWRSAPPDAFFDQAIYDSFPNSKQMYFCNFGLKHFCQPTDWIAFTDVDEFLCLQAHGTIGALRADVERRGFAAIALNMLIFGHAFNITAPPDHNICAFIRRADHYTNHGKFFAHVGALQHMYTPHFANLFHAGLYCDGNFAACTRETSFDAARSFDLAMPHLKHFMILDVYSCFQRRMRTPIDINVAMRPDDGAWVNRVHLLRWSSDITDVTLATSLIDMRARAGMAIDAHVRALARALARDRDFDLTGAMPDFAALAAHLGAPPQTPGPTLLHMFFSQPAPDPAALRFFELPADFDPRLYQILNPDLPKRTDAELARHFVTIGHLEGRPYSAQTLAAQRS